MTVLRPAGVVLATGARRALVLTLFLIGLGLSSQSLREVGVRPFALGLLPHYILQDPRAFSCTPRRLKDEG